MTAVRGHITRTGAYTYQISEGQQAYVPPTPEAVTKEITVHFPADSSNYWELTRLQFAADVDFADASLSNVATVTYYKNGNAVTGNQSFAVGDRFAIEITRTSPAADASVLIDLIYDSTTDNFTVTDYRFVSWGSLTNMSEDDDTWLETLNGLRCTDNGSSAADKTAVSEQTVSGEFTLESDFQPIGCMIGITVDGTADFSTMRHAWYCSAAGVLQVYEEGSAIDTFIIGGQKAVNTATRIIDTGTAIEYWYRAPSGAWTLRYTSLLAYTPSDTYNVAVVMIFDGSRIKGVKIYE